MGGVVISPNIKKVKEMIDLQGNVIDPHTKKIIKKEPPEYIPPPAHVLEAWKEDAAKKREGSALGDKIAKMIEEKVAKIVEEKIEEALKGL